MASCAQCGRRTQDGFVLVSHEPVPDMHSHSDAYRNTKMVELAATERDITQNLCGKCVNNIVDRVDVLIGETEAYNTGCIKYIADPYPLTTLGVCILILMHSFPLPHCNYRLMMKTAERILRLTRVLFEHSSSSMKSCDLC